MEIVKLAGLGRCRKEEGPTFLAYFCLEPNASIDRQIVDFLKNMTQENPGKSVRICLHQSPEDRFHNMLIAARREGYVRPHKHLSKDETFHMIDGEMMVVLFDDTGAVVGSHRLGGKGGLILRVEAGSFHTVIPLSEVVVFHESTTGPYASTDRVFPAWAPDGSDTNEAKEFLERIA